MPKYYRFRAISPTRKSKSGDDGVIDKEKGRELQKCERSERALHELTPAQLWFLRRTAWREPAAPAPHARQLVDRWACTSAHARDTVSGWVRLSYEACETSE